jgi:protocatechuate 3,4-dioxygenase beta subunit
VSQTFDRRHALGLLGGAALALLATACGSGDDEGAASPSTTSTPTTGRGATATCTLAPDVTQGPYWLTDHPEAADLVQDREGVPLTLALTVVDAECLPVHGAKVDIWHCDAEGTYAGVGSGTGGPPGGPGGGGAATRTSPENWLQGYQTSGSDGAVTFRTIYPGWYRGRAVHVHLKVFVDGADIHTGQLFFPDDLSKQVFASAPYQGDQDTLNSSDNIYSGAGAAALLSPAKAGNGYTASAQLVVGA